MPKAKPPPEDDLQQGGQGTGVPPADDLDPALGNVSLSPDLVRNTPEYRELMRQNRILARQKGEADAQAARVRSEAEAAVQAAEAQRMAAQEARVREILGDDGVAVWEQFADLSSTDPVKAAELLAQYAKGQAQSQPPVAAPEAAAPTPERTQQVNTNVPPATGLSRTVGDAPLAGPADDTASVVESLEKRYVDVVDRNQDPARRNRVTMKDRANAMIAYVGAAYLKAGAKPKS